MFVSVIIPVYNVEKYIEKCILSVINNDLSIEEYEIIVVDDESPDNSLLIVRKLMLSYPQIKLFSQKNKGLGGARNTGINNAKGDYVLFLDADDYYLNNKLQDLIQFANNTKFDIIEFGALFVDQKGNILSKLNFNEIQEYNSAIEYVEKSKGINSACNKLYSNKFINLHCLEFKEKVYAEDFEFNSRAFLVAKKIFTVDLIIACFLNNPYSITRCRSLSHINKYKEDLISNLVSLDKYYGSLSLNKNQQKYMLNRLTSLTVYLFFFSFKYEKKFIEMQNLKQRLDNKGLFVLNEKLYSRKRELFRFLLNNCFYIFRLLYFIK